MSSPTPSKCVTLPSDCGRGGETSLLNYLQAQLDYNDVVKQYVDTAIRHRQSMLSLNTTVGRRILP